MKDLNYHKKQVKQKQAENRFQQWADKQVESVCRPILAASQERRDRMQQELKLQRCKLERSIKSHPYFTFYNFIKPLADPFGLNRAAELANRECFEPFI